MSARRTSPSSLVSLLAAAIVLAWHSAAPAKAAEPASQARPAMVRGASISGADFGTVPGTYGTDYTYPTEAEIDYYADHGFNALRLPFLWERIQHELNGPLDTTKDGPGDFDRVRQVVEWITQRGMIAVLDPHNYAGRRVNGTDHKLGSAELPVSALADLWVRLANAFKENERVWFGLMNEPFGLAADDWKAMAQSVTDAIRATGARNFLLVPGTAYSGAHTWVSSGNAAAMETFVDPADNFAFEVHQYLDSDSSGKQGACSPGSGASRLAPFIDWAKAAPGRKGFLGEFAAGDPTVAGQEQCKIELAALLDTAERSGVFIGWAAWGGGLWWQASYIFRLEPVDLSGPETPYMRQLRRYLH